MSLGDSGSPMTWSSPSPSDELDHGCLGDIGLAVLEVFKFLAALVVGAILATLVSALPSAILVIGAIVIVVAVAALGCIRTGEWTILVGFYTAFSLGIAFYYWVSTLELWKL